MNKPHVETRKTSGILCGEYFVTHICDDGLGKNAVEAHGRTPEESRQRALDGRAELEVKKIIGNRKD